MGCQSSKTDLECKRTYLIKQPKVNCPKFISHPLRTYEFSKEELKVLEDCDKESFYQRCLPLELTFAALTYGAVRCGFLKRNRLLGALPKVGLSVIAGHALGRTISYPIYEKGCINRLPQTSYLANLLRQYKRIRETPPLPTSRCKRGKI